MPETPERCADPFGVCVRSASWLREAGKRSAVQQLQSVCIAARDTRSDDVSEPLDEENDRDDEELNEDEDEDDDDEEDD